MIKTVRLPVLRESREQSLNLILPRSKNRFLQSNLSEIYKMSEMFEMFWERSHIMIFLSWLADIIFDGSICVWKTQLVCASGRSHKRSPVVIDHTLIDWSYEPETSLSLSKQSVRTKSLCPSRTRMHSPVFTFHILIVLSLDPDTTNSWLCWTQARPLKIKSIEIPSMS